MFSTTVTLCMHLVVTPPMQIHDPAVAADLLVGSADQPLYATASTCGRAGAVLQGPGQPTTKPLPPRERARAAAGMMQPHACVTGSPGHATAPTTSARGARGGRVKAAAPTASVRGRNTYGTGEPTPLGHTMRMGARRTMFWAPKVIDPARATPADTVTYRSTVGRSEGGRVGFWEAGQNGPPGGFPTQTRALGDRERVSKHTRPRSAPPRRRSKGVRGECTDVSGAGAKGSSSHPVGAHSPIGSVQSGFVYVEANVGGDLTMFAGYTPHQEVPVPIRVAQYGPTSPVAKGSFAMPMSGISEEQCMHG